MKERILSGRVPCVLAKAPPTFRHSLGRTERSAVPPFLPHAVEEILKQVEKPGRYIGGEWNEIRKKPSEAGIKIALVFPDVYEIGMSYLGQKILYSVLNRQASFLAERVFAPWPDMEEKLRASGVPLYSLENKIPLRQFDILGFSLLYELNYSNILTILNLGQIPFKAAERGEEFPLVLAGGPAAFNPEPVSDIFDAFLLGDGEEAFLEIAQTYISLRKGGAQKEQMLSELMKLRGVYVPRFYSAFKPPDSPLLARRPIGRAPLPVQKRILSSLEKGYFPDDIIVPDVRAVFDRLAIEVARGCPQRCRFCQATNIYLPFRIMNTPTVLRTTRRSLKSTGYEDVSLSALSVSDHPCLEEMVVSLMGELSPQKISLSLSSLRPTGLSSRVAENILKVRKTGFTIVPEVGTDRLRRVVNKSLSNQEILGAAENAFQRGWQLLKLYFMVGLPTEKDEDLDGIVGLVGEVVRLGMSILHRPPRLNLSLSSFIPKPHTPFQWLAMEEEAILREKQKYLFSRLRPFRSVRIKEHPIENSLLEAVFSRGDKSLGMILEEAWRRGARFDGWKDAACFSYWKEAFGAHGLDYRSYFGPLNVEADLPWGHIDTGITKDFLRRELGKALQGERTPSCLEMSCAACRGCTAGMRAIKKSPPRRVRERSSRLPFGKKTDKVFRYEVTYSKSGRARFLSHLDLINHLQRILRRAGIEPSTSEGFHPKMLISYAPALPLGMEGRAECFEFKSIFAFDEKKIAGRLNRYAGSGITFLQLRKLKVGEPNLNDKIRGMLYSVNLKSREIQDALKEKKDRQDATVTDIFAFVEEKMAALLSQNPDVALSYSVDKKKQRLTLQLSNSSRRRLRPQDIIGQVFGLLHPAFVLVRERFIFQAEGE